MKILGKAPGADLRLPPSCGQHENERGKHASGARSVRDKQGWLLDDVVNWIMCMGLENHMTGLRWLYCKRPCKCSGDDY